MGTDRELLEAAAKAAGIDWIKDCVWIENGFYSPIAKHERISWNPLTDDGDALRLAVKLKMGVNFDGEKVGANCGRGAVEVFGNDPYAATRRAIVRAAAEIGRSMK